MPGYYMQRQSRAAMWCARLASVALPYFAMVILLHRFEKIITPQAYWLVGFGLMLVLLAVFLGARAALDMWNHGYKGGRLTVRGLLISVALLLPFAWMGYLAMLHPSISDVSTNPYSPPQYIKVDDIRSGQAIQGMNQLADYTPPYATLIVDSYPKLASRRYNAGAERINAAATALIGDRDWIVIAATGLPGEVEGDGQADEAGEESEAGSGARLETAAPQDIRVEAVARSLIFGFHYDVLVQIVSEAESTLVDMRVSARWGRHDFGASAKIIEDFLADLDASLLGIAGEG